MTKKKTPAASKGDDPVVVACYAAYKTFQHASGNLQVFPWNKLDKKDKEAFAKKVDAKKASDFLAGLK